MTAVTQKGMDFAVELMKKGYLNRYQNTKYDFLSHAESALANHIGLKYALGVNSGASALFLCLKAIDIKTDEKILTNAFTFNAVPSSIVHAGGVPVLIECTKDFVMDTNHLITVLDSYNDAERPKILMLSYMRGRVPNMDVIMNIVNKYKLTLIEDIAHAYPCMWNGKMLGTFGLSAAISTQANKIMNSGEGGFILTNDDNIQAKAIIMSGCYEQYYLRHNEMMPSEHIIQKYIFNYANYSLRMTNLQGAILLPQIAELDERRTILNKNYKIFCDRLRVECKKQNIEMVIPEQLRQVTPVYDSIQFVVKGIGIKNVYGAINLMKSKYNLKVGVFGHPQNARNPKTWQFLGSNILKISDLKNTSKYLEYALDMRLPLNITQQQISDRTNAIVECLSNPLLATSKL
eukprot:506210_1